MAETHGLRGGGQELSSVIAKYASSRFYRQTLKLLLAFLKPKLLTPEQFGLWTLLKAIPSYALHANLGSLPAMRYLIPLYRSSGDIEKAGQIRDTGLVASLVLNGLMGSGLLLLAFRSGFSTELRVGLLTMALVVVLQSYEEYYIALLKARERFLVLTTSVYSRVNAHVLLTIPLLYFLRLYGVFASLVLSHLFAIAYLRWKCPMTTRFRWDGATLRGLVTRGLPIMLSGIGIALTTTLDRWVISWFLGTKELGYYGIAVMMFAFLKQVPGTAREVLEPRLMSLISRDEGDRVINEYLLKPMVNTAFLMPFLIGPVFFLFPLFVFFLLPRYTEGVVPTQILSVGVYFLTITYAPQTFIVAMDWQLRALVFLAMSLVLNACLSIFCVAKGLGLAGVAVSSSLSFLFLLLSLLWFLGRKIPGKGPLWRRHLAGLAVPFPAMMFSLLCIQLVVPLVTTRQVPAAFLAVVLWTLLMFLLYRVARRRLPLLSGLEL